METRNAINAYSVRTRLVISHRLSSLRGHHTAILLQKVVHVTVERPSVVHHVRKTCHLAIIRATAGRRCVVSSQFIYHNLTLAEIWFTFLLVFAILNRGG